MAAKGKGPVRGNGSITVNRPTTDILFPLAALPGRAPDIDWGGDPSLVLHHGVFCQGPQCLEKTEHIRGIRYKCSKCPNVDFDDTCMRDPANTHDRSHEFWPCCGECVFEDSENMSSEAIRELNEFAGHIHPEFLPVPQQEARTSSEVTIQPDAIDLGQLANQLSGNASQVSGDQLLIHWKNGIAAARLIELQPGDLEDNLYCNFTSTRLDEPEDYNALCCDWAPDDPDDQLGIANEEELDFPALVFVGEQSEPRPVTKVTADALRALRSPDETIKLWVKELCILPLDPKVNSEFQTFQEKSISLIYNRAARTIVWAGNGNEHTERAWLLIEILSHLCKREDGTLLSPSDLEQDPESTKLELLPIGSDKWQSLVKFFPPHLFTQGWLLHDVAFATKAVVKCSIYELEWWQVARVRDMLAQPSWTKWLKKLL